MSNEFENYNKADSGDAKQNAAGSIMRRIAGAVSFFVMMISAVILIFVVAFTSITVLPAFFNAESKGENVGVRIGNAVGWAVGSFNGITDGKREGAEAGKEEGLSAKDTSVTLATQIKRTGKLEVMSAGIKMTNINTVGENDYSALFIVKGNAVFSVDLSNVEIKVSDDFSTATVTVPDVDAEIYIDNSSTEKLAEHQKHKFTGSSADGFTEYINSSNQLSQKAVETISNYEQLKEAAVDSARKQITELVKNFNSRILTVTVIFSKET